MKIDMLNIWLNEVALRVNVDRATTAYSTLINGDGNSNPATNYDKTTLQGGAAGDALTWQGYLKFMAQFFPHEMTTIVVGLDELVQIMGIRFPNIDPTILISQLQGGGVVPARPTMAQSLWNPYRIVYLPTATDDLVLALDKRYALEMVTEIGADLTETENLIGSQWKQVVLSEVSGFAKILPAATKTLTLDA